MGYDVVEAPVCAKCNQEMDNALRCQHCRAIRSPFSDQPDMWLLLPEKWKGQHSRRLADASQKAEKLGNVLSNFAGALSVLEDWNIPGLNGNPENWDFEQIDLVTISWVNFMTITNPQFGYLTAFSIPKNYLAPSLNGQAALQTKAEQSFGKTEGTA